MSNKHLVAVVVLSGFALVCGLASCQSTDSRPVQSLTIGTTISEVNSLILIAQEQGYFADNGLEVVHKVYPSGVAALDGVLSNKVDLATGSEFAFANNVLAGKDVRTVGAICRSSTEYLVGRIDKGVGSLDDLEGKRIGVPLGSRPEFALDRFLYLRGIDVADVNLVDVPVNESVDALLNGEVDAVAAWQPYIDRIRGGMGSGLVSWSVQEDQPSYTLLMGTAQWVDEKPELIARLLRSLAQAETYVAHEPQAAQAYIRQELNYSADYMASVWADYRFSVLLDQTLVVALEDQARWIIAKQGTGTRTPNFVRYIYVDALEVVKPEAVSIIH